MISGRAELASDSETPNVHGRRVSIRRWARPSPWLLGLLVLLAMAGIAVTQEPHPRLAHPPGEPKAISTAPSAPALHGTVYTPAMVADRNFRGADLSGARLVRLDLRGADFQGVNAAGAIFVGSFLNGVNFSHADLRGADLRNTCLRGANFADAQLAGADFTHADVTGVTATPRIISGTIGWTQAPNSSVCPRG